MGSLPTGSDKLLEIQSGNTYVVIKSKNPHPNLTNAGILRQPSELRVTGVDVNSIRIFGEEKLAAGNAQLVRPFTVSPHSLCSLNKRIMRSSSGARTGNPYQRGMKTTPSGIRSVP